jgi:hypothetical protein
MKFHDFFNTGVVTGDLSSTCGDNYSDLKGVAGVSWLGGTCYAVENELEDTEGAYIFEDFSTRILVFGDLMAVSCAAYVWALETGTITREGF